MINPRPTQQLIRAAINACAPTDLPATPARRSLNMAQTLRDRLMATAYTPPTESRRWTPEIAGEAIAGTITDIKTIESEFGPATVVTINDDVLGLSEVMFGRAVLKSWLEKNEVKVGDGLGIRYEGQVEAASGNKYHDYTLRLEPAAQTPNHGKAPKDPKDPFEDE